MVFACSEKKSIACQSIDQDVILYFGRKFEKEKVIVRVGGRIVFQEVVSTDRSTDVAANTTIRRASVGLITIIFDESDSIEICPRPFIVVNRISGQVTVETYDSLPKLRFL
jgi:hypothetical protein